MDINKNFWKLLTDHFAEITGLLVSSVFAIRWLITLYASQIIAKQKRADERMREAPDILDASIESMHGVMEEMKSQYGDMLMDCKKEIERYRKQVEKLETKITQLEKQIKLLNDNTNIKFSQMEEKQNGTRTN